MTADYLRTLVCDTVYLKTVVQPHWHSGNPAALVWLDEQQTNPLAGVNLESHILSYMHRCA